MINIYLIVLNFITWSVFWTVVMIFALTWMVSHSQHDSQVPGLSTILTLTKTKYKTSHKCIFPFLAKLQGLILHRQRWTSVMQRNDYRLREFQQQLTITSLLIQCFHFSSPVIIFRARPWGLNLPIQPPQSHLLTSACRISSPHRRSPKKKVMAFLSGKSGVSKNVLATR